MSLNNETELLAKKMSLESQWNMSFAENGIETFSMYKIDQELKEVKRQIRDLSLLKMNMNYTVNEEERINESGC